LGIAGARYFYGPNALNVTQSESVKVALKNNIVLLRNCTNIDKQ